MSPGRVADTHRAETGRVHTPHTHRKGSVLQDSSAGLETAWLALQPTRTTFSLSVPYLSAERDRRGLAGGSEGEICSPRHLISADPPPFPAPLRPAPRRLLYPAAH